MRPDEKTAHQYLCYQKVGCVVYEPDGNVPPDFLVDRRIAVEVRRLNQNVEFGTNIEGLEKCRFPLRENVEDLLPSLGAPVAGTSWFVFYWFKRPLDSWKRLEPALRERLEAFRVGKAMDTTVSITENFRLHLFPASAVQPHCFVLGGFIDRNAGGWILRELSKNLEICIEEKTRKIANFRKKYPEWWLVLIDRIAHGLPDDSDQLRVRDWLTGKYDWDRVILVNPLDARHAFEVYHR